MRIQTIVVSVGLFLVACRPPTSPMSFDLRYMSTDEKTQVAPTCAAIGAISVTDARSDPSHLGERKRENFTETFPISMRGDAAEWTKQSVLRIAKHAAFTLGEDAARPTLQMALRIVEIQEKAVYNSNYSSRVVFETVVMLPDGKSCPVGMFSGEALNYGKPGLEENYQQTLSHALDKAVAMMLNDNGVRSALCGQCESRTVRPTSADPN